jgi:hypothetical protein
MPALAYRITEREPELVRLAENGIERVLERIPAPPPPPEWLQQIIRVRRSIGDPITLDFIYVTELPENGPKKTAFTTGNGDYWYYDGKWKQYDLKFGDGYIRELTEERGRHQAALTLITNLIARIDPADYITSGNVGGQSTSFPSLADMLAYYNGLRDALMQEEAAANGTNSGLMLRTKRRPVGGVLEYDDGYM